MRGRKILEKERTDHPTDNTNENTVFLLVFCVNLSEGETESSHIICCLYFSQSAVCTKSVLRIILYA